MPIKRKKISGRGMLTTGSASNDETRLNLARKKMLADWCRLVGRRLNPETSTETPSLEDLDLSLRLQQTLTGLLGGDSEKQIAAKLKISPHTVHTYVKNLHRRFNVTSRGELLAKFVQKPTYRSP